MDEIKYLREENKKLLQIASAKGHGQEINVGEIMKEKDRLIDHLKSQLKAAEGKGKGGLSLLGSSGHKHTHSDNNGLDLKQENE